MTRGLIPPELVEEIKDRTDIVNLVNLMFLSQKKGRNFWDYALSIWKIRRPFPYRRINRLLLFWLPQRRQCHQFPHGI